MSTTCRVRIYVPVDGNGNYKTTDNYAASECRGHYDLQICRMGYIGTTTNRESFSSPIISYGHTGLNNRRNEVAFFESGRESSMYGGNRVRLYYWSFTADDDDITNLLVSLGGYLDGDNPTRENTYYGKLARYEVIKAPYNTYSANKTNCFRAVAQWTKALGKSQLQNIYDDADSSSDYYAYKLANQLAASYWTDMGIKNY